MMRSAPLVIGIGTPSRSDDTLGLVIADRLDSQKLASIDVRKSRGDALELMTLWKERASVYLVDALSSGNKLGTILRRDLMVHPLTDLREHSTHAFGVAQAVELARALDQLPQRLVLWAIEGNNFEIGDALSFEVEQAIEPLIQQLLREVSNA